MIHGNVFYAIGGQPHVPRRRVLDCRSTYIELLILHLGHDSYQNSSHKNGLSPAQEAYIDHNYCITHHSSILLCSKLDILVIVGYLVYRISSIMLYNSIHHNLEYMQYYRYFVSCGKMENRYLCRSIYRGSQNEHYQWHAQKRKLELHKKSHGPTVVDSLNVIVNSLLIN